MTSLWTCDTFRKNRTQSFGNKRYQLFNALKRKLVVSREVVFDVLAVWNWK